MQVLQQIFPFMKDDIGKMIRLRHWFGQPITNRIFFHFFLEGSEKLIPNNKYHSKVFIQVTNVAGVMNTMMSRANKNCLEPCRHFFYVLRMHENAIDLSE